MVHRFIPCCRSASGVNGPKSSQCCRKNSFSIHIRELQKIRVPNQQISSAEPNPKSSCQEPCLTPKRMRDKAIIFSPMCRQSDSNFQLARIYSFNETLFQQWQELNGWTPRMSAAGLASSHWASVFRCKLQQQATRKILRTLLYSPCSTGYFPKSKRQTGKRTKEKGPGLSHCMRVHHEERKTLSWPMIPLGVQCRSAAWAFEKKPQMDVAERWQMPGGDDLPIHFWLMHWIVWPRNAFTADYEEIRV